MILQHLGKVLILLVVFVMALLFFLFINAHYITNFISSDFDGKTDVVRAGDSSRRELKNPHGEVSESQEAKEETSPLNQFQEAKRLFHEGKYQETILLLKEILTSHPF